MNFQGISSRCAIAHPAHPAPPSLQNLDLEETSLIKKLLWPQKKSYHDEWFLEYFLYDSKQEFFRSQVKLKDTHRKSSERPFHSCFFVLCCVFSVVEMTWKYPLCGYILPGWDSTHNSLGKGCGVDCISVWPNDYQKLYWLSKVKTFAMYIVQLCPAQQCVWSW